jgi:negative regulator of sigma E activity
MGLGKTLTALVVVAHTLQSSYQYKQTVSEWAPDSANVAAVSVATLVVVPSIRENNLPRHLPEVLTKSLVEIIDGWTNEISRFVINSPSICTWEMR